MSENENPSLAGRRTTLPWSGIVGGLSALLAIVMVAFYAFVTVKGQYTAAFGSPAQQAEAAVAAAAVARTPLSAASAAELQAAWGQYGDYVGGELNPFLAFLSFAALVGTLLLQSYQLHLARVELHETRDERKDARTDTKAQLKAARTLAAAQLRTARAQERAALVLGQQLTDARDAQFELAARQVEQLQAARDLVDAQLKVAVAMERAAEAQEQSAVAADAQFELARGTAASQSVAATAQFAAALFQVAAGAKEAGYPGPGSDLISLHKLKPEAVSLLMSGLDSLREVHAPDDIQPGA